MVQLPGELQVHKPAIEVRYDGNTQLIVGMLPLKVVKLCSTIRIRLHDSQTYVDARIQQFATAFVRKLQLDISDEAMFNIVGDTIDSLRDATASRGLRLMMRHACK